MTLNLVQNSDSDEFWREFTLPQEDWRRLTTEPWKGGYRWFRSENVIAIEHFQKPRLPGQKAGRFGWVSTSMR